MQRPPLVIAVAQPLIVSYDVVANAAGHADAVRAAQARVVIFPELSLTGYELDAPAITADDPRLAPIVKVCAERGATALVGAPVQGATAALGMDVYVASVLDHAHDAHVPAERAQRVIADRGVWVATASFAGSTGGGFDQAAGGSAVCAPDGGMLAQAGPEPGKMARATLRD